MQWQICDEFCRDTHPRSLKIPPLKRPDARSKISVDSPVSRNECEPLAHVLGMSMDFDFGLASRIFTIIGSPIPNTIPRTHHP